MSVKYLLHNTKYSTHKYSCTLLQVQAKYLGFPGGASGEDTPASAGDERDTGLIPGSGRSPGGGHDNPLQCSCLEKPTDRGAWRVTVHKVERVGHN